MCQPQFLTSFWQVWPRVAGLCSGFWLPGKAGVLSWGGTRASKPQAESNCWPTGPWQTSFLWCCLTGAHRVSGEGVLFDTSDTSLASGLLIHIFQLFLGSFLGQMGHPSSMLLFHPLVSPHTCNCLWYLNWQKNTFEKEHFEIQMKWIRKQYFTIMSFISWIVSSFKYFTQFIQMIIYSVMSFLFI